MPRYFFHSTDGIRDPDLEGTELPDAAAAQLAAIQFAGQTLADQPQELWNKGQWRVEVTDERGRWLFSVVTLALDGPEPEGATVN